MEGPDYIVEALWPLCGPTDELIVDQANTRQHDVKNLTAIKDSLSRFKQRIPIVVQAENMVVRAGNGRLMAARELGWDQIARVIVREQDIEAVAFAIADNRTAELAEWDYAVLSQVMKELNEAEPDLLLGWEDFELQPLLEAEWSPPAVGELESPDSIKGVKPIILDEKQRQQIEVAIELYKEKQDAGGSEGHLLACICREWMSI
jgi:hypothetical protein